MFGQNRAEPFGQRVRTYVTPPEPQPRRASIAAEHDDAALLEVASVEDSVQNRDGRPASDPPRQGNSSQPQLRQIFQDAHGGRPRRPCLAALACSYRTVSARFHHRWPASHRARAGKTLRRPNSTPISRPPLSRSSSASAGAHRAQKGRQQTLALLGVFGDSQALAHASTFVRVC